MGLMEHFVLCPSQMALVLLNGVMEDEGMEADIGAEGVA
jgi:hypothetical protein